MNNKRHLSIKGYLYRNLCGLLESLKIAGLIFYIHYIYLFIYGWDGAMYAHTFPNGAQFNIDGYVNCYVTDLSSYKETPEGEKDKEVFISIQAFPALLDVTPSCDIKTVGCGSRHTAAVTCKCSDSICPHKIVIGRRVFTIGCP